LDRFLSSKNGTGSLHFGRGCEEKRTDLFDYPFKRKKNKAEFGARKVS